MKTFSHAILFALAAAVLSAQTVGTPRRLPRATPATADTNAPAVPSAATNAPAAPAAPAEAAEPAPAKPAPSAYTVRDFSTYQPILDRMPFGKAPPISIQPPANFPDPNETRIEQEQQALARAIQLQAVVTTPDGRTAAGFSDRTSNPEKYIYLAVGETKTWNVGATKVDFQLVSVEYSDGVPAATIIRDNTTVTLKLGSGQAAATALATASPPPLLAPPTPVRTITPVSPTLSEPPVMPITPRPRFDPETPENWPMPTQNLTAIDKMLEENIGNNTTYRERLQQRRADLLAERAQQEAENAKAIDLAAEARAADAFLAMMRHANLDNIRNGGDGLGIPLTPEEDAMLTREGVLPTNTENDDGE